MNDFEIVFYQRANGECPVGDFLDSLNKVMRFKMMNKLDMLELYGNHPAETTVNLWMRAFSSFVRRPGRTLRALCSSSMKTVRSC